MASVLRLFVPILCVCIGFLLGVLYNGSDVVVSTFHCPSSTLQTAFVQFGAVRTC